ncbi:CD226 antigen-like [Oreochromis niloticus]|uniref:CD226 antigen-like n=1 Tax=Oreochromis niloticus TaxID=8128 RepID=UPI000905CF9D|nr:CD226 antigen-like [Oreochromis niloticus]
MPAGPQWLCSTLLFVVFLSAVQENITAESGQDVTLTCRAPNNNIRVVKWSRHDLESEYVVLYENGRRVSSNQHPSFKNRVDLKDKQMKDGDVSLILKDVTTTDTGTYECHVFMIKAYFMEPISKIDLNVVPPDKNITAEYGQDVTLTCRAPNNNKGVKWSRADLEPEYLLVYQDGHFVSSNQHPSFKDRVDLQDRQMKDGDVSLILKDVNTADSGTYVCRVFTEETRSWKNSIIYLTVVDPGPSGGFIGLIAVVLILPLVTVVGFLIYRKHKLYQYSNKVPTENNEAPQAGLKMTGSSVSTAGLCQRTDRSELS